IAARTEVLERNGHFVPSIVPHGYRPRRARAGREIRHMMGRRNESRNLSCFLLFRERAARRAFKLRRSSYNENKGVMGALSWKAQNEAGATSAAPERHGFLRRFPRKARQA